MTQMPDSDTRTAPRATVAPILRLEGLALATFAIGAYAATDGTWHRFALMLLVPDLAMLAYAAGPRLGAACYNAAHSLIGPAALAALGVWAAQPTTLSLALIWAAHIGIDRMLGYGLKYASGFRATHLGRV